MKKKNSGPQNTIQSLPARHAKLFWLSFLFYRGYSIKILFSKKANASLKNAGQLLRVAALRVVALPGSAASMDLGKARGYVADRDAISLHGLRKDHTPDEIKRAILSCNEDKRTLLSVALNSESPSEDIVKELFEAGAASSVYWLCNVM